MTGLAHRFASAKEFFRRASDYWKIYGTRQFLILAYQYLRGRVGKFETNLDAIAELLESPRVNNLATPSRALYSQPFVAIIGELSLPQCKKYRVLQKMEVLTNAGISNDYSSWQDGRRAMELLQFATAVIFYRVPSGDLYARYVKEALRLGVTTLYDIDDPVFSRSVYAKNRNLDFLTKAEKSNLINGTSLFQQAMQQSDYLVGSTPRICSLMEAESGKEAYLWRNLLDVESTRACVQALRSARMSDTRLVLGYASGSRAHEADFRTIAPVLVDILRKYDELQLRLIGHLELPPELVPFKQRIIKSEFTDYLGYMEQLSSVHINLVPLLLDDFNDSKSAIRYMEASALGIPSIVSSVGDFQNIIENGVNGYLAAEQIDWKEFISLLCDETATRDRIGSAARDTVLSELTTMDEQYLGHIDPPLMELLRGI